MKYVVQLKSTVPLNKGESKIYKPGDGFFTSGADIGE